MPKIPEYKEFIQENTRRREDLFSAYDPIRGIGSPLKRVRVVYTVRNTSVEIYFPLEMVQKEKPLRRLMDYKSVEGVLESTGIEVDDQSIDEFLEGINKKRFDYDFEFWAAIGVTIQDKETKEDIPFSLNKPQRKLLLALEEDRLAGVPIRVIVDKARQWGGSTLIQNYMGWIQIRHRRNWHSAIIADVENQVGNIRHMFIRMAKAYPKSLGTITLKPFEGSSKNKIITERGGIIGVGSAQEPDNLRSFDFAMLHLSECGIWKTTQGKSPEDLAQSLRSTVPEVPLSLIVMESTAKGVGNFFHNEWLAAISKRSGYKPVFVAWWEIERYQRTVTDMEKFVFWMQKNDYAMFLWNLGATLEGINWYFHFKKAENYDDWRMASEYPSTHQESFQSTGHRVYPQGYVQKARATCKPPEWRGDVFADAMRGKDALKNVELKEGITGLLSIWNWPEEEKTVSDRYAVIVDIGGTTNESDNSVIKVFDRYGMIDGGVPEVAAVWEGHLDPDLIAWKAAQIGWLYNKCLVVVEVNSLVGKIENTEGTHHLTILDEIVDFYPELYMRTDPDKVREGLPAKYGFHTNKSTKSLVINRHKAAVRDEEIIEYDKRTCDEMDTFEVKPNGSLGAVEGCRDDHVITTAIGAWICLNYLSIPKEIVRGSGRTHKKIIGEATI